jgi:hypothetical protein
VKTPIPLLGQWLGYYEYGPGYGKRLRGNQVMFRLFIDSFSNGEFEGRAFDFEGIGANYTVAQIKGFVKGNLISFTKQYPHYYYTDKNGDTVIDETRAHPVVNYQGEYNASTNSISGDWDLNRDVRISSITTKLYMLRGSWKVKKDD